MNAIKQCLLGAVAVAALIGAPSAQLNAQQTVPGVSVGTSDLGGVVTGPNGPEAGVWVIAETTDLPTKFAKIVVTDDQGRYLLPELPKAKYKVWVRGYGLVDSAKVDSEPGKILNLTAVTAPNAAAAAEYYPAIYWYAMLGVPDKSEFPGTGPSGNGIPTAIKNQSMWLDGIKTNGCVGCHQIGNKATRTIAEGARQPRLAIQPGCGAFRPGRRSAIMVRTSACSAPSARSRYFADWTDRIARGELPTEQAAASAGRRAQHRGDVVGLGQPQDVPARRDRDRPAQSDAQRQRPDLRRDRAEHRSCAVPRSGPAHDRHREDSGARSQDAVLRSPTPWRPSPYCGDEPIWDSQTSPHNPMIRS